MELYIIIGISCFIFCICISSCFFTCMHFYKNREKCILKIYTDEKIKNVKNMTKSNILKKEDYIDRKVKKNKKYKEEKKISEEEKKISEEEEKISEEVKEIHKEFEIKII